MIKLINRSGHGVRTMRTTLMALTLALAMITGFPASLSADDLAFSRLFNGVNLEGWIGIKGDAEQNWRAKNNILSCTGTQGAEWIATHRAFDDFELRLDFNLPENGNSGVFIRAPKDKTPYVHGMEIQLLDDYGEKWKDLRPAQFTGAIYEAIAPSQTVTLEAGAWQTLRILCVGSFCKVWVNDRVVVEVNLDKLAASHGEKVPGLLRKSGVIGFQNHGDPVFFRNIRIREI